MGRVQGEGETEWKIWRKKQIVKDSLKRATVDLEELATYRVIGGVKTRYVTTHRHTHTHTHTHTHIYIYI